MTQEEFDLKDVYFLSKVTSPNKLSIRREGIWMCVPILEQESSDENGEWHYIEHRANINRIEDWYRVIPTSVYRLIHSAWLDEVNRLKDIAERLDVLEGAFLELADIVASNEDTVAEEVIHD